jgi:hypothetical protein
MSKRLTPDVLRVDHHRVPIWTSPGRHIAKALLNNNRYRSRPALYRQGPAPAPQGQGFVRAT